ncbi:glycoside hydrolase family 97 protein [Mariniphaga sediminis]|uniref:glycoside hydrolase family 97 protein n=1 Tax=Mariniphaga sediminis TaxID=1628158 RepID=UPI00356B30A9
MKQLFFISIIILLALGNGFSNNYSDKLYSPDGRLCFTFFMQPDEPFEMSYSVSYNNQSVVLKSPLGIQLTDGQWLNKLELKDKITSSKDTTWIPVYGERNQVRDHYNETVFVIGKQGKTKPEMRIVVRAYNEGIAFRYLFPEYETGGPYIRIKEEETEFTLPENTKAWYTFMAQQMYHLLPLNNWPGECERPLTLQLPDGLYLCLTEAEMVNYARTKFKLSDTHPNTLECSMYSGVDEIAPVKTPWRVIMVAERPGQLLENNDLILNLNEPCAIEDPSWIRPGKVVLLKSYTTQYAKKMVDLAVTRNLQYIHFDASWYGPEYKQSTNATTITVSPHRYNGPLDMKEVCSYAKERGIGVIVYVNQRELDSRLDEILPLYQSWGISGIKFGFVHVGSHRWTYWMHEAVKKCAEYGIVVNIHDEYRPTGFSRTYPNLMTQEGILGNEGFPGATHNTILPFTRFVAGAADYTICYYHRSEIKSGYKTYLNTTSAHQLSLAALYYSPLQYVYWYDSLAHIGNEPELEFFDAIPTVWDDTKVIHDNIGNYVTIARQSGEQWFVGSITNAEAREIELPLDFLPKGVKFEARIYFDDPLAKTRTKVGIRQKKVDSSTILKTKLLASGGQAIWLSPEE